MIAPPAVKSKPYGVFPVELIVAGPAAQPSSSIAYALMLSVPRSVTTIVRPSTLKEICAGSTSAALSGRTEPSRATRLPSSIRKAPDTRSAVVQDWEGRGETPRRAAPSRCAASGTRRVTIR
jgi:hypothetical protein